jgi:nicotinamide riboside transporter PnuC
MARSIREREGVVEQQGEFLVAILQGIAITTGLVGSVMNAQRRVGGFYFWLASNTAMVVMNMMMGLYGMVFLFVMYSGICVHGIRNWARVEANQPQEMFLDHTNPSRNRWRNKWRPR